MPSVLVELPPQATAYQQSDAVFDRPQPLEDFHGQYGPVDQETLLRLEAGLAPSIGLIALDERDKVDTRHQGNQPGQHEWLYDMSADRGEKSSYIGLVPHAKARKPDLSDPGMISQAGPQIRIESHPFKDIKGNPEYNQVTRELIGWEALYAKPEVGTISPPAVSHEDDTTTHKPSTGDVLSHVHLIGDYTLALLRQARILGRHK